ncbi:MAG: ABC transporter substrate-binding protein [Pseudomonadota bacterium]|nr:ABC transporter substrate-binding protein [Pseudomonadota bacterium]
MNVTRRSFMATAAAGILSPYLLSPAQAQAAGSVVRTKVITTLTSLDPIYTTAYSTRNHGYMVFDTLFGLDAGLNVQPQMVDIYDISEDGLTYTFTLRDGLAFHDETPVTSEDCIASIQRWMQQDLVASKVAPLVAGYEAVDDTTFVITLTQPFAQLVPAMAKVGSNVCFIMPARLAATPPSEQITEMVGSGPYRFAADEYVADARAVYVRNEAYVPRSEPASGTAGGKVVNVDRVEWLFMDDMAATSAIQSGEIEFYEEPSPELLPVLEAVPGVTVGVQNTVGMQMVIRPNHTQPPFDNPTFRQAFMKMINPEEHLLTYLGDPELFTIDGSVYPLGTPFNTEVGSIHYDPEGAQALLEEAGYNGEPIYVLQATNIASNRIFSTVTAEQLRRAGLNVQVESSDFGTMFGRALANEPVADGNGWHLIHFANIGPDMADPITSRALSGAGDYLGWSTDEEIETLRADFLATTDLEEQKAIAEQIQVRALELGFYYPGGTFMQPNAYSDSLTDIVESPVPVYWNMGVNA